MKPRCLPARPAWVRILGVALLTTTMIAAGCGKGGGDGNAEAKPAARPALTVTVTTAQRAEWPRMLTANGNR